MKIIILIIAAFAISIAKGSSTQSNDRFFIIGHMKNDIKSAREAISDGANALEIDLNFNARNGLPTRFWHGYPCDESIFKPFACARTCPYKDMLGFISKQPKLALIVLEGKVKKLSSRVQKLAGMNVVKAIEEYAFTKGFKGTIVISSLNSPAFIESAAKQASISMYKSQIYFSFLMNYSGAYSVIRLLQRVAWPNIIYSVGSLTLDPEAYYDEIRRASQLKAQGSVSNAFTWTINWESGFTNYYNAGARGITTNYVKRLSKWSKRRGLSLARPGDGTLRPATNKLPPVGKEPMLAINDGMETSIGHDNAECGLGCVVGSSMGVLLLVALALCLLFKNKKMNTNAYGYEIM